MKLTGTLKITANRGADGALLHFEVVFVPYVGRFNTIVVKRQTQENLETFLIELRMPEDEAMRWAGKVRVEGIVLVSPFERTNEQLTEHGLLA
jgi:hypothetical protein